MYRFTYEQGRRLMAEIARLDADYAMGSIDDPLIDECVNEQQPTMRELERRADRATDERVFEQLRRDMGDEDQ